MHSDITVNTAISFSTIRKRAQRVNARLPESPQSWAETIKHVIKTASSWRRSLLQPEALDVSIPAP